MRRLTFDRFTVTTELVPPRGADADACRAHAAELATFADAINITDGAGAAVRMSAVAATAFVAETGAAPIVQLTVRDRNRIALAAELLGAAALGAQAVLPLGGDPVAKGENPDAVEVRELTTVRPRQAGGDELNDGQLPSGRALDGAPPNLADRRRRRARLRPGVGARRQARRRRHLRPDADHARRRRLRGLDGRGARARLPRAGGVPAEHRDPVVAGRRRAPPHVRRAGDRRGRRARRSAARAPPRRPTCWSSCWPSRASAAST